MAILQSKGVNMVKQLAPEYKKSPEYKVIQAVYKNWKLTAPKTIERGWNLMQYMDAMETYDAIQPTDSETYTQICEYFIRANFGNWPMVQKNKYHLTPEQIARVDTLARNLIAEHNARYKAKLK